ncbi:hypothetical protein C805_03139 [Eubacterium sp. 14-2]|uniref:B12-binding domain-containing radical SAM protein n=1 Tax=Eubacterium sp. 14-2 TaxID=1235790 RepID=UPI000339389F|nr:B12-binding domain-containing radical SAM protein [Eubacterium sp. 14-2]EOT23478.1 hypothetical protein C805_03139 [Eubacterium sp. 14-2]
MKILLAAINAKYIHSNLAVYSLKSHAKEYKEHISLAEYTINHRTDYILQEIYKQKPDVLCFSCYIWNFSCVQELIPDLHRLLPDLAIWAGGPEVSYEPEEFLTEYPMVAGVLCGEGEETFRELCGYYLGTGGNTLEQTAGLVFRNQDNLLIRTLPRKVLPMDELPFCYEQLEDFENRIIYYETSRGCPFSCSYCLSSIEKELRFRSFSLVKEELQFFLDHQVPQVKFVDRTFNCNHSHALEIWQYLKDHDNGKTNFHFEIAGDLLTEEELALIASMRPGLIQLEIGVQSTHPSTLREICRTTDMERLEKAVGKIRQAGNVHQHLDLIAGLPEEDFHTFGESFRQVYQWKPQQLQLGFLKVLKGSRMQENREKYGLLYRKRPPYEVLATNWISYEEILDLKLVEEMLEVYYNSGQFEQTMKVLELTEENPFELYLKLGKFYESRGLLAVSHSRLRRCEILLEFAEERDGEHTELYQETLIFDLYLRENCKTRPGWAKDRPVCRELVRKYGKKGKMSHLELFFHDMEEILENATLTAYPRRTTGGQLWLFFYEERDILSRQAKVIKIQEEMP